MLRTQDASPPAAIRAPKGTREIIVVCAVAIVLSAGLHFEFLKVHHGALAEWPGWHRTHLQGYAVAPLQYRVFSWMIPELIHRLFRLSVPSSYLAERALFLTLAAVTFHRFCRKWLSALEALVPVLGLFFFYALSVQAHLQPAEEPNLFFFAVCLTLIRDHRFGLLLPIFCSTKIPQAF